MSLNDNTIRQLHLTFSHDCAADMVTSINTGASASGQDVSGSSVTTTASTTPTARTLATRFGEVINVKDWGVKGDGVTDDAPKIQALIDRLVLISSSSVLKTLYFPAGSYELGHTLLFAQRRDGTSAPGTILVSLNVLGEGYSTRFRPTAGFVGQELMRFEDVAECIIGKFSIVINHALETNNKTYINEAGPDYVAFTCSIALHLTATGNGASIGSSEHVKVYDVDIDGGSNVYPYPLQSSVPTHLYPAQIDDAHQTPLNLCWVGFGVSLDYPNDISEHRYYNVNSKNCGLAAIMGGNGIPANVLDCSFFHCTAEHSPVGVFMNAFPIYWYSGTVLSNKVVDFFSATNMSSSPTYINGLRTENSNRFWWAYGGSASAGVTLSNIFVQAYHGFNHTLSGTGHTEYYSTDPYSVDGNGLPNCFGITTTNWDGYVIRHQTAGSISVTGCAVGEAPSGVQVQTAYSGGNLGLYVFAANNMMDGEAAAGSEVVNKYYPSPNVFYNVIGQGAINSGVPVRGRLGNFFTDHCSHVGGRVGIGVLVSDESITPTYGLYQLGGCHRLEKLATPAIVGITQAGTPGVTSRTYYIIATDSAGNRSSISAPVTTTTSNATLSSSNYNVIEWTLVEGAVNYDILKGDTGHVCTDGQGVFNFSASYKMTYTVRGFSPQPTATFHDVSNTTTAYTPPTRNETADSTIDGMLTVSEALAIPGGVKLSSGSGVPGIAGAVGDYYFRTDTPGTATQRIYVCTVAGAAGAATWVATAA